MKRIFALLTTTLLALIPAPAQADTQQPVIGSGSLSSTTAEPGETITATWNVTDDVECCDMNRFLLLPSNWDNAFDALTYSDNVTQISGNSTNGTYRTTFNAPSTPGNYEIAIQVTDESGKFSELDPDNNAGVIASLTVEEETVTDTQQPVIGSGSLSSTTAEPGETITATWSVTDDLGDYSMHRLRLLPSDWEFAASDALLRVDSPRLISGTDTNGTYRANFTVPTSLTPGNYEVSIQVIDGSGKYSELDQDNNAGIIATLTVEEETVTDVERPVVVSGSISPSVAEPGQTITATWNVTDDVGCCDVNRLYLLPTGFDSFVNEKITFSDNATQISGTGTNGTYRGSLTIPANTTAGQYEIGALVTDNSDRGDNFGKYSRLVSSTGEGVLANLTVEEETVTDTQQPVIGSGSLSSTTAEPGETITATWSVTDDVECCDMNRFLLLPSNWDNAFDALTYSDNVTQISGNSTNGTYRTTFNAPSTPGNYEIAIQVTDESGKFSELDPDNNAGVIASLTVEEETVSDTQQPVIGSGSLSSTTAEPGETITATWNVTDDVECCDMNRFLLLPSNWDNAFDALTYSDNVTQISGNSTNGTYRTTFTAPSTPGNYEIAIQVTDESGKYSELDPDNNAGVIASLTVSQPDSTPPQIVLNSVDLEWTSVYPGDNLLIYFEAEDETSCCLRAHVEFGAPGKGLIWDSQYNVKQSENRSEFLFEITIPTDASGTQKLFGYAIDSNGNEGPIVEIGSVEVTEPFESIFTVESDGSVLEADFAQGETVNLRYLVEDGSLDASRYSQTITLNGVSSTFRYTDATETSRTSTNDLLSTYWSTSFDIPLGAEPGVYEVSVRVTNGSGKSFSARLAEIRVTEAIDDPLVFNPQPELFPWLSERQIFSDVNIFQGPVTINFNGSQSTSNVLTDFSRSSLQIESGPTSFLLRGPEGAVMNSNSPSVIESGTSLFTQISGLTPNASLATYLIPVGKSSQSYTPSVIARSNALGQVSFDNQIQAAPGDYNLEIVSSDTSIPTQVVPLSVRASSYGEMSGWTVNQGDGTAKVYIKFPTVGEKVRIGHQKGGSGSYETIYVKTTDSETMNGLKIVLGVGTYIVRTIDLVRGTNRIKVTVGENQEVQVRYNR